MEYNDDTSEMKLYVNDIYLVSSCLYTIVLAGDTNVFLSGQDSDALSEMMNKKFYKLFKWLKANKLFRSKQKSVPTMKTQVKVMDECIGGVLSTQFLGVRIDCHLNCPKHINYLKTVRG